MGFCGWGSACRFEGSLWREMFGARSFDTATRTKANKESVGKSKQTLSVIRRQFAV